MQHLALCTDDLVDRLDHVHRNTDRAGLVRDGPGNRLTDPPGCIGREFVTATVFEFIDRLHQADIAFLDQIQELQATVGVFLRDGDHEAQVGLDHFLLGDARFAFALLHRLHDAAEIIDRNTDFLRDFRNVVAGLGDLGFLAFGKALPLGRLAFNSLDPVRLQLAAEIVLEEFLARHAIGIAHAHQLAFHAHQLLVDGIELFDQRFDPGIVDVDRLQVFDDRV